MSLIFNNVEPTDIIYNGTELTSVVFNGVEVWKKIPEWHTIFTGSRVIYTGDNTGGIINAVFDGIIANAQTTRISYTFYDADTYDTRTYNNEITPIDKYGEYGWNVKINTPNSANSLPFSVTASFSGDQDILTITKIEQYY